MINYLENQTNFLQLVNETAKYVGFTEDEVLKDYYLSRIIAEIVREKTDIVLKGGTSLSKCYNIIHRFSEDIDLAITLETKNNLTKNGSCKYLFSNVQKALESVGFKYQPFDNGILSKTRAMNRFDIILPKEIKEYSLRPNALLEAEVFSPAFPCERKTFQSYIGKYINYQFGKAPLKAFPELNSFDITVQRPERTMIDKVFALADTSKRQENQEIKENDRRSLIRSRDLYDVIKIEQYLESTNYDFSKMPQLIERVKLARSETQKTAYTSRPGITVKKYLDKALSGKNLEILRNDFNQKTRNLISDEGNILTFDQTVEIFKRIVNREEWKILERPNTRDEYRIKVIQPKVKFNSLMAKKRGRER